MADGKHMPGNGSEDVLKYLVEQDGLSDTLQQIRQVCLNRFIALVGSEDPARLNAPKWTMAAEEIERAIARIKYDIKL